MAATTPSGHFNQRIERSRTQQATELRIAPLAQFIKQEARFVPIRPGTRTHHLTKSFRRHFPPHLPTPFPEAPYRPDTLLAHTPLHPTPRPPHVRPPPP